MSVFRNITNSLLVIQGYLRGANGTLGVGAEKFVNPGDTFTGSNYYKRFTYNGMIANGISADQAAQNAILEVTYDDGTPWTDTAVNAPNNPRVYNETIPSGTSVELDFNTDLPGPALFVQIETDSDIIIWLNSNINARMTLSAGSTQIFNNGELLLNSIILDYTDSDSGDPDAHVQVIVANIL